MTLILNNDEVASLFDMDHALALLEAGYRELGEGRAVIRPMAHSFLDTSRPDTSYMFKSFEGGIEQLGVMALRIASEHHLATPQGRRMVPAPGWEGVAGGFLGLVLLFSTETTELLAIMPDGYLQSQRVGATWALGAKHLAREDVDTMAIYGSGQQAPAFLAAHLRVRPGVNKVKVYSPTPEHRRSFAERMGRELEREVVAVGDPREAMRGAGIVLSVTNSRAPVVFADWLEPGMHIGAISPRQTDEANFFPRIDRWVAHHRLTTMQFNSASQERGRSTVRSSDAEREIAEVSTLADLLCGRAAGRTSPEQITYFGGRQIAGAANDSFGSSGTGVQFSALGHDIYQRAKATGVGREIPTDWFFETLHP